MNIFNTPSKYPVGIDISDLSMKLVQLNKTRQAVVLQTLSRVAVPSGYIDGGAIKNKAGAAELLRKLLTETIFGKVSSREAVVSLPETKTFIKLLSLNSAGENLSDAVKVEIAKNIPYELADVNYDWQVINQNRDRQKILIAAVPKKIADDYAAILEGVGLLPVALEIEAAAIARSILPLAYESDKTTLILDIGASRSGLIAYADGAILFTASLPISGKKYTAIIAQKLNLTLAKAEEAKIICGLDSQAAQGIIAKTLKQMTDELVAKIKAALQHLAAYYPANLSVGQIYLCGGGASLLGLDAMLKQKLNIEVTIGDIFTNIRVTSRQKEKYLREKYSAVNGEAQRRERQQDFSLTFAAAAGLALRSIYLN
ncbi:hypothetical protein COU00_01710 [Candidatus Falkowbacteria bacterium CG10_big_fil_rev_8_21_14_0_10_43_11]|uniref:SHS2 domain-containing protein n=1 Tax=Candidatus Falkowbacteria bacterium CG10_big_fil_rev_8_21_14_0_10_43_11 TaxID=1974568 RepID=A0A2M6WME4_9BACT|nr:MAG: hypothetical protein COU00_01710 [Candidatus Falkowbacteria bacterium CG10_big_fil_rev_8_21_14_0_10_43_11]